MNFRKSAFKIEIKKVMVLFILLLFTHIIAAQNQFGGVVEQFLNQPNYKNAGLGISIYDIETEKEIFNYRAEKLMVPASTLKLVTSAAALDILGSDYRFKTLVASTGNIKNNTLKGNLVIKGGGDPVLGSRYFRDDYFAPDFLDVWVQKIKNTGITQIKGDIIFDGSAYSNEIIPPTWIWEDMGNYYGAGASAFSVYDNTFRITFRSPRKAGQATKIIAVWPKIEGLEITNRVVSSDENRDLAYVFGSPIDTKREIRGTIPKNRKAFTIKASMPNPEQILANELFEKLAKTGVFISGKIKSEKADVKNLNEIYTQQSPPLNEIIKVLNHESVNLIAEHLLKQIAYEKTGLGDRQTGLEIVQNYWKNKGLNTHLLVMEDGSGLSHFNAVAPEFFTQLLLKMKNNADFKQSLPTAGKGTLYQFKPEYFENETLRAKSGSMTRVRCYAGYMLSQSGRQVCFSVMLNNFPGTQYNATNDLQNLLLHLRNIN